MTQIAVMSDPRLVARRIGRGLLYVVLALVLVAQPIACGAACMLGPFGPLVVVGLGLAVATLFALYVAGPRHHAMMLAWEARQRRRAVRAQLKQTPGADPRVAWAALRDELRASLIARHGEQPPVAVPLLDDVLDFSRSYWWAGLGLWAFLSGPFVLLAVSSDMPGRVESCVSALLLGLLWSLEALWSVAAIRHLERAKVQRSYLAQVRHITSVEELAGGLTLADPMGDDTLIGALSGDGGRGGELERAEER
jgi:heme exporter protein D